MGRSHRLVKLLCAVALAAGGALWLAVSTVAAGEDSITGVVRSASGAEAGVWVIAETDDLETLFRKIVVTNDDGRFLIPDLPEAVYTVWVRGYGLVDSVKAPAHAGDDLALEVVAATTPREAAGVYPANYWYSLLEIPGKDEFPGTGPSGNGISPSMRTQAHWIDRLKDGCQLCHQMGQKATREVPNLADYDSTHDAWNKRVQIGGSGASMTSGLERMGRERAVQMYAGWTDRIMAGEVPEEPPRPSGVERNLVLTQWGWSTPRGFIHDEVATDKRNPTLYPNGKVYGVDMLGSL
ncbi:MAG TPA: carboxypeptidase regulatory-like domain-containing protein, partial [Acidobacteria bacterium]|nr:carboxypeptidase regulatory-like domain-containing protein [Acidobacteriota bacterium]